MKKSYQVIVSIFCAALLLMSLSACSCRHEWTDATCTEPKVCSKCGETEGDALGHSWGSWKVEKKATATESGTKEQTCSRCGKTQTTSYAIESLVEDGHLLLSPKDFCVLLTQNLYCQQAELNKRAGEMVAGVTGVGGFDPNYTDGDPFRLARATTLSQFFPSPENWMYPPSTRMDETAGCSVR